jgi:predicted aldo/keto reductase-like oxidoreductase
MKTAIETAEKYITSSSEDTIGREIIQYLLQESVRNPRRPISSKEIKAYLLSRGIEIGDPITKISDLRGKGVLIISPIGKKGYKLPTSEEELADFYNRLSSNVIPQLIRGNVLNDVLNEKTIGKYNILGHQEFRLLCELCNKVKDFNHLSDK